MLERISIAVLKEMYQYSAPKKSGINKKMSTSES